MADTYIDYLECLEYGDFFLNEVQKLAGASALVDIVKLHDHVAGAMIGVAAELEKQGIKRSTVRVDRKEVEARSLALRKDVEKFYHYLGSLDEDVAHDADAFFPGGNQGSLAALKPADLAQKAGEILRGFSANANKDLPEAAKWRARIEGTQGALVGALAGKGTSSGHAIQGTTALVAARETFLVAYNGVAKRIVLGLLVSLGRKDELKLFFKDLQVNESRPSKAEADPPAGTDTPGT
ncbi:hypothetical protein [Polyangium fumosum]|uniref:Uncharacterized protein n=1 Tax=Polyangium fumosum TaxID=889272 RepID=A0A4U1JI67_9BACT|nr:hypothetical protein [Polyangium fumosum]TKD12163.1 hypothetical protein E8A74_06035 [Polyangium fumosum]